MYPLNLLADLNVLAGAYLHASYMTKASGYTPTELVAAVDNPANRQIYGDTTYITIPAKQLPLLVPFRTLGKVLHVSALTTPIADLIEPTLKVLVELGYDRSIPYGQPTKFRLFPKVNLPTLVTELRAAGKAGIQAALADVGRSSSTAATTTTPAAATAARADTAASGATAHKPAKRGGNPGQRARQRSATHSG